MKNCKYCGEPINSNNRHRNSCYDCKVKYPYVAVQGGDPFNRKELIA